MIRRNPEVHRAWQQRTREKSQARAREPKGPPESKPKRQPKLPARTDQAEPAPTRPARRSRVQPRNPARAAKRRLEQFGPEEHVLATKRSRCACTRAPRQHPECDGGWCDPSHTTSRAAGGGPETILPMTRGCHNAWHQHGRAAWLLAVGWTDADLAAELERHHAELAIGDPLPA